MTTPGYGYILYTPGYYGYYGYYQVDNSYSQSTNTNNSYKPISLTETVQTVNSMYSQENYPHNLKYYYSGDSIFNNQNLYTSPFKEKNEHCHKKKSKQNTSTKSQHQSQSVKLNTIQESQNE
jgi:hypothetical protein